MLRSAIDALNSVKDGRRHMRHASLQLLTTLSRAFATAQTEGGTVTIIVGVALPSRRAGAPAARPT